MVRRRRPARPEVAFLLAASLALASGVDLTAFDAAFATRARGLFATSSAFTTRLAAYEASAAGEPDRVSNVIVLLKSGYQPPTPSLISALEGFWIFLTHACSSVCARMPCREIRS